MLKPVLGSQLNLGSHLTRGLVGCWLMNEGSGNKVFDLSGNGNTGTLTNSPSWAVGKFGSALEFDGGSDQYVDCGSKAVIDNIFAGGGTVYFWIYLHGYGEGSSGRIFLKGISGVNENSTQLWVDGSAGVNKLTFFMDWTSDALNHSTPAGSLLINTWYMVAVTYNRDIAANKPIIYINGISQTITENQNGSGAAESDAAETLHIGSRGIDREFDGLISHGGFYNRILSASEIALLYRAAFQI